MRKINFVIAFLVVLGLVMGASFVQAGDLDGKWNLKVTSPMGSGTPEFKLKQDGKKLTGHYKGTFGEAPVKGSVDGNSFNMKIPQSGAWIVYTGTFAGNTMKGTIDFAGQGNGDFTGTRAAAAKVEKKAEVKTEKAAETKVEKAPETKAEPAAEVKAAKKPVKKVKKVKKAKKAEKKAE